MKDPNPQERCPDVTFARDGDWYCARPVSATPSLSPMPCENLELDFHHRPPQVSVDQVESVCAFLAGKGWVKAAQIEAEIEISDRRLRRLAEKSDGRILSGQQGYRLFDSSVPVEEVDHAANWLISQGRTMIRRGVAIRRRYHSFARGPAR